MTHITYETRNEQEFRALAVFLKELGYPIWTSNIDIDKFCANRTSDTNVIGILTRDGGKNWNVDAWCIHSDKRNSVPLGQFIEFVTKTIALKRPTITIGDYEVMFARDGGSIVVGCQDVTFKNVEAIYKHMNKLRESKS